MADFITRVEQLKNCSIFDDLVLSAFNYNVDGPYVNTVLDAIAECPALDEGFEEGSLNACPAHEAFIEFTMQLPELTRFATAGWMMLSNCSAVAKLIRQDREE